jgi:hypothetical protein
MGKHLVENFKIVSGLACAALDAHKTGDYVSLKNVQMAFIVCNVLQGDAGITFLEPRQASLVDGTGAKVLTNNVPIWSNLDVSASDTLVRRTDAKSYALDAGVHNKQVVFQIDPASLDVANGFDCLTIYADTSAAGNLIAAEYFLAMRYSEDVPPAVITD